MKLFVISLFVCCITALPKAYFDGAIKDNAETFKNSVRFKRFSVHQYGGWNKTDLTYRIRNYLHDLKPTKVHSITREQINRAIKKAFQKWASISCLTFKQVHRKADIDIKFGKVDGEGKGLGLAYWPFEGGDIQLDKAEPWTYKAGGSGIDLFQFTAHLIGHSLGLGHTFYKKAVMNPGYRYREPWKFYLDDKIGINYLYYDQCQESMD